MRLGVLLCPAHDARRRGRRADERAASSTRCSSRPASSAAASSSSPPRPGADGATVYSRMVGATGSEDPATGSASGPLGCYLVKHGLVPPSAAATIVSAQGVKMGRPEPHPHPDRGLGSGHHAGAGRRHQRARRRRPAALGVAPGDSSAPPTACCTSSRSPTTRRWPAASWSTGRRWRRRATRRDPARRVRPRQRLARARRGADHRPRDRRDPRLRRCPRRGQTGRLAAAPSPAWPTRRGRRRWSPITPSRSTTAFAATPAWTRSSPGWRRHGRACSTRPSGDDGVAGPRLRLRAARRPGVARLLQRLERPAGARSVDDPAARRVGTCSSTRTRSSTTCRSRSRRASWRPGRTPATRRCRRHGTPRPSVPLTGVVVGRTRTCVSSRGGRLASAVTRAAARPAPARYARRESGRSR